MPRCSTRPSIAAASGVMLGAGTADLIRNESYFFTTLEAGIERARPSQAWNHFANTPGDVIAEKYGFEGQRACVAAACSSSTIALGQAMDAIRLGRLDAVVAGGTDALARLTYSGFNALRLMDPRPCRPFDRSRAGMNIGEGAGMLVLEEMDCARRRGARIYAELAGYSLGCEAFHPTAPRARWTSGGGRGAKGAGRRAGSMPPRSTMSTRTARPRRRTIRPRPEAFRSIFGDRVARLPVTSLKSMIGHCLGAAGALEAAIAVLTVARGVIPPTINYAEADPECPVDVVANVARADTGALRRLDVAGVRRQRLGAGRRGRSDRLDYTAGTRSGDGDAVERDRPDVEGRVVRVHRRDEARRAPGRPPRRAPATTAQTVRADRRWPAASREAPRRSGPVRRAPPAGAAAPPPRRRW